MHPPPTISVQSFLCRTPVSQNCTHMPARLDAAQSECIIAADDPDGAGAREAAQRLVPELAAEGDDRDWRSRSALPEAPAGTPAAAEAGPPRRAPPSDGPPKVWEEP